MTVKKGEDDGSFYAQVVAAIEKHSSLNAVQQKRDTEAMINAAITKAVQREVAGAIKEMFGATPTGANGALQGMNDQTIADVIMHGSITSSLLRSVYGLVPSLLNR